MKQDGSIEIEGDVYIGDSNMTPKEFMDEVDKLQ